MSFDPTRNVPQPNSVPQPQSTGGRQAMSGAMNALKGAGAAAQSFAANGLGALAKAEETKRQREVELDVMNAEMLMTTSLQEKLEELKNSPIPAGMKAEDYYEQALSTTFKEIEHELGQTDENGAGYLRHDESKARFSLSMREAKNYAKLNTQKQINDRNYRADAQRIDALLAQVVRSPTDNISGTLEQARKIMVENLLLQPEIVAEELMATRLAHADQRVADKLAQVNMGTPLEDAEPAHEGIREYIKGLNFLPPAEMGRLLGRVSQQEKNHKAVNKKLEADAREAQKIQRAAATSDAIRRVLQGNMTIQQVIEQLGDPGSVEGINPDDFSKILASFSALENYEQGKPEARVATNHDPALASTRGIELLNARGNRLHVVRNQITKDHADGNLTDEEYITLLNKFDSEYDDKLKPALEAALKRIQSVETLRMVVATDAEKFKVRDEQAYSALRADSERSDISAAFTPSGGLFSKGGGASIVDVDEVGRENLLVYMIGLMEDREIKSVEDFEKRVNTILYNPERDVAILREESARIEKVQRDEARARMERKRRGR